MKYKHKIRIKQNLFWDVNWNQIDFDANKNFVIGRVLAMGDIEDYYKIRDYYGSRTVLAVAKKLKHLDYMSLNFWSIIFNVPKNKFLCFQTLSTKKQNPFLNRLAK